jgi:hypothetical protein
VSLPDVMCAEANGWSTNACDWIAGVSITNGCNGSGPKALQRPMPRRRQPSMPVEGSRELLFANYPHPAWGPSTPVRPDDGWPVALVPKRGRRIQPCLHSHLGGPTPQGRRPGRRVFGAPQAVSSTNSDFHGQWARAHRPWLARVAHGHWIVNGIHPAGLTPRESIRGII